MKGLSSTRAIVFFKGESGYLGNHRMPTHRPWDGEKTRPKKEAKKAKQKERRDSFLPNFISFFFLLVCVFSKQAWWSPVGWDGEPRRWGCVCVCVWLSMWLCLLFLTLSCWHFCIPDFDTQHCSDVSFVSFKFSHFASLTNMFNILTEERPLSKRAMANHASLLGNLLCLHAMHVENVTIPLQFKETTIDLHYSNPNIQSNMKTHMIALKFLG